MPDTPHDAVSAPPPRAPSTSRGLDDARVEQLLAQRALLDLVLSSWEEIDLRRGVEVAAFFTPDAIFDLGPARYVGREEIASAFASRVRRGPRTARHMVTNLRVALDGHDRADVSGYMVLYASDGEPPLPLASPAMMGEITDQCVRDADGRWLIQARSFRAAFLSEENPSPFMNSTGR